MKHDALRSTKKEANALVVGMKEHIVDRRSSESMV